MDLNYLLVLVAGIGICFFIGGFIRSLLNYKTKNAAAEILFSVLIGMLILAVITFRNWLD
jgi:hypothetical protein